MERKLYWKHMDVSLTNCRLQMRTKASFSSIIILKRILSVKILDQEETNDVLSLIKRDYWMIFFQSLLSPSCLGCWKFFVLGSNGFYVFPPHTTKALPKIFFFIVWSKALLLVNVLNFFLSWLSWSWVDEFSTWTADGFNPFTNWKENLETKKTSKSWTVQRNLKVWPLKWKLSMSTF